MKKLLLFLLLFGAESQVSTKNLAIDAYGGPTICENCDEVD